MIQNTPELSAITANLKKTTSSMVSFPSNGRTWICVASHCGSGMVSTYSVFSRKTDFEFFEQRHAYGHKPNFNEFGWVPVLSLEETLTFLKLLVVDAGQNKDTSGEHSKKQITEAI